MENNYNTKKLPFDTASLYSQLDMFLRKEYLGISVGGYKYGVYCFYDYDCEPIYVGQTKEGLATRIRRHLTNQRTDAVAMSVLDPYEVYRAKVWPLPEFQFVSKDSLASIKDNASKTLDSLEYSVYKDAIASSRFGAILNEKVPPNPGFNISFPNCVEGVLVSDEVYAIRRHPDVRIARRAQVLSRLTQVINERRAGPGLRKTLVTQAKRLQWISEQRYSHFDR